MLTYNRRRHSFTLVDVATVRNHQLLFAYQIVPQDRVNTQTAFFNRHLSCLPSLQLVLPTRLRSFLPFEDPLPSLGSPSKSSQMRISSKVCCYLLVFKYISFTSTLFAVARNVINSLPTAVHALGRLNNKLTPILTEHVLKPSASNSGLSASGENIRPPIGPGAGFPGINLNVGNRTAPAFRPPGVPFMMPSAVKRPSPTPSIKRSKAERLLKEHGSPPNVRVTAGGRIVPNDLPQLGSPRVPITPAAAIRGNIPGRVPIAMPLPVGPFPMPGPNEGFLAYDNTGRLVQFIEGRWQILKLDIHGQAIFMMPPPNVPFPSVAAIFPPPPPIPAVTAPQVFHFLLFVSLSLTLGPVHEASRGVQLPYR